MQIELEAGDIQKVADYLEKRKGLNYPLDEIRLMSEEELQEAVTAVTSAIQELQEEKKNDKLIKNAREHSTLQYGEPSKSLKRTLWALMNTWAHKKKGETV
jgi:hypothetical protein